MKYDSIWSFQHFSGEKLVKYKEHLCCLLCTQMCAATHPHGPTVGTTQQ